MPLIYYTLGELLSYIHNKKKREELSKEAKKGWKYNSEILFDVAFIWAIDKLVQYVIDSKHAIEKLGNEEFPKNWFFTILNNIGMEAYRRSRRGKIKAAISLADDLCGSDQELRERRVIIKDIMEQMCEECREILYLKFWLCATHKEIESVLKCKGSEQKLKRCLKKFQRHFNK